MEKYDLKLDKVKFHNIVIATTSEPDYEMNRFLLLEDLEDTSYGEYVVVEGYHCSCYGFDETVWDAIKYTEEELYKIATDRTTNASGYFELNEVAFYNLVLRYLRV